MDSIVYTDLRTVSFDVPPQEILTRDSVTISVDAVVFYRISDPMAAVCKVTDHAKSTKLLASTTLRTILGTKILSELLAERDSIVKDILTHLADSTSHWGIMVNQFENISTYLLYFHIFSSCNKLTYYFSNLT